VLIAMHSQIRILIVTLLVLAPGLAAPGTHVPRAEAMPGAVQPLAPRSMWTRYWQVNVRRRPGGPLLNSLDIDQEVRVNGATTTSSGVRWLRILLWGTLTGWIRADLLAGAPVPLPSAPTGVPIAPHPVGPHGPMTLRTHGIADGPARIRVYPDAGARLRRIVPSGTALTVISWATDSMGQAWYHVRTPLNGWVSADHVNLVRGAGSPSLTPLAGLGMWLTDPVLEAAPPSALIAAATASHVTHLYVEVAGSHDGFWGKQSLATLLPVAHAAHIAVIAWVYPFLDNVPRDVDLAVQAARYAAPSGDHPDGIMADVEQNMHEPYVRAYSQIVRARLGPTELMAITTYAPQSYWGLRFPFSTLAPSWDVIAPQDYWHTDTGAYSGADAARYVTASIHGIRRVIGLAKMAIDVIGQMFDVYQSGYNSPSAAEIISALHAATAGHVLAVSFFEWNHATPAEWQALRDWNAPMSAFSTPG
jgi:hypothetical protein